ncbi:MAG: hypothetical protein ACI4VF_04860 [Lachnospirales bacterium]
MMKMLFEFDKETKRTYRYTEVGTSKVKQIYINKDALKDLGANKADRLNVVISKADD